MVDKGSLTEAASCPSVVSILWHKDDHDVPALALAACTAAAITPQRVRALVIKAIHHVDECITNKGYESLLYVTRLAELRWRSSSAQLRGLGFTQASRVHLEMRIIIG